MQIVLPKLNKVNVVKATVVLMQNFIGWEPCDFTFNGKKWNGVKVYTSTGYFKCFCTPAEMATKLQTVLTTGEAVQVKTIQPLLSYKPLLPEPTIKMLPGPTVKAFAKMVGG